MIPIKMNICLTDDDEDDRIFFATAFESIKINNTLTLCEDGFSLMEYINTATEPPHIIFLDLNMPGKSGMECLREIRNNSSLRNIAIAIFSTSLSDDDIEGAFIAGANIYIKKPNEFETLEKILNEIIYINWQYITDGLNRENFIINYND